MAMDDDNRRVKPLGPILGEDLSLLSIEEIEERIDACQREIERLEAALADKRASRAAADSVFRR
jgi:uncharacterized small protein (DUF1192 family)